MKKAFYHMLFHSRFYVLAVVAIFLIISAQPFLRSLEVNNSLEIWFKNDAPALKAYHDFNAHFGSDELVVIVATAPNGWLDTASIAHLNAMNSAIGSIPEVQHIHSAANTKALQFTGISLAGKPMLNGSVDEIKARLERMPELKAQLFNSDYTATRLLVQFRGDLPMDEIRGMLIDKVKSTAQLHWPKEQLAFGGVGVIFSGLNALTEIQFGRFVGMAYLIMLFLLWFLFRSWRVSLLALGTMTLTTVSTLALYGLAGHRLNLMTVLIPMVVLLLSTLDVVHLMNAWFRMSGTGRARLEKAIREVWKPCLFTTLTTMAGFLALTFSPMAILQQFGLYSAIGIGLSLAFTWLLASVLLPGYKAVKIQRNSPALRALPNLSLANGKALRLLILIAIPVFAIGIFQLKNDTYTLGYLPKNHQVVQDHQKISDAWGDYMPLELMISTRDSAPLTKGVSLSESIELHRLISNQGYSNLFGYTSLYLASGRAYGYKNDSITVASAGKIERQLVRHYPDLWNAFVNEDGNVGRITLFGEMRSADELGRDMDALMDKINSRTDNNLSVKPAGYLPLYAELVPYVTTSQVRSLLLAGLFIGLLMWGYFNHWKLALIALFTNAFPIIGMFGLMGWLGIELDIATASTGAIGLSFCVDDAIHFTSAWQSQRKNGKSVIESLDGAYHHTGKAIVFSSMILCAGFAVMLFSPLKTVFLFGMLTCVMVVLALIAQLVIFPWLIRSFEK
ncbi:MAG: MMPL family transporter [Flavobacteriales bacterium]|nr:MMPL family transporter [Flavobacteriales bacterium]